MKGKLKHWNEAKGFGFIATNNESQGLFIHISALKKMSRPPIVGDMIIFQTHIDNNGKKRAINAEIQGVSVVALKHNKNKRNKKIKNNNNGVLDIIFFVAMIVIGLSVFSGYFESSSVMSNEIKVSVGNLSTRATSNESYHCEGKVHCSEMSSCEESKFYLSHCSGTKIDGDRDGIPCERQWCN
jgi:cold shock CspA family protein